MFSYYEMMLLILPLLMILIIISYITGKQAQSKVNQSPGKPKMPTERQSNAQPKSLHCKDCKMTMNSESQYNLHMNSKRHSENTGSFF